MAPLPYQIYNAAGQMVLQAAAGCRYPAALELDLISAGYTIKLDGKRITKAEIKRREAK